MTKPRDPDALLSAYLADGMTVLPNRVVDSVMDEVHRTRQRAVFGSWRTRSGRFAGVRAWSVAGVMVAIALGLILVGAAILAGARLPRQPEPFGPLLYQRDGDIVLASLDGTDSVVVADGAPSTDLDGTWYALESWAPDGRYFVYHESHPGQQSPVTHIADKTGRLVASFDIEPASPGTTPDPTPAATWTGERPLMKSIWHTWWSPDSTLLAVFPWSADVRIFGLDGVMKASLPLPPGYGMWRELGLRWARDSQAVFVVITAGGGSFSSREVWRLRIDGALPERIPSGHPLERWDVAVSPDGSQIAFSGLHAQPLEGPIYIASADGSDPQPIAATSHPGNVSSFPMWSPEGTRLAYMVALSEGGLTYELRVVDLRTGTDILVATVADDDSLNRAWSPDGERLLLRAYEVRRANASVPSQQPPGSRTALWSVGLDGTDVRLLIEDVDFFELTR